jgi:hypothetical protein
MKRWWLYAGGALLGILLLSSWRIPIRTTPESACRVSMDWAVGYGPWRFQGRANSVDGANRVIITYSDGFNTNGCIVRALGPLWYVEPYVMETSVGCSLGIDKGMCPRRRYGVAP